MKSTRGLNKNQLFRCQSPEQLEEVGEILVQRFLDTHLFLLFGKLGAGKTTLTKGIARALGVNVEIVSPTFTFSRLYKTFASVASPSVANGSALNPSPSAVALSLPHFETFEPGSSSSHFSKSSEVLLRPFASTSTPKISKTSNFNLLHVDLYRLLDSNDLVNQLDSLGLDEALETGDVVVVEWPEPIVGYFDKYIQVVINVLADEVREVEIVPH
ncbi:MAG: tRNA (adenosine(37)-N6)-threonylcarbamoyltransferase complex ATPase subunit type 1 TsaE [Bifidobacteriaceae bacterium]|jgi:tRNA A37 threonylcarbamoyladenosine biosynthesis protein TsaE|nr:tRNA (adenosine(37)-N6)-threonylcarbamoyltransferase complex ATPase subunit type 1 TsaE [Bifidobacteriaceae bacterium]